MQIRQYISVVGFVLVVVLIYLNRSTLPNQQIIVQISETQKSYETSYEALEHLKFALEQNGARHLSISELEDGHLKITYYSASEIYDVQKALMSKSGFKVKLGEALPYNETEDESGLKYSLHISEFYPNSDTNWDFESTEVTRCQYKGDRFLPLKKDFNASLLSIDINLIQHLQSDLNHNFPANKWSLLCFALPDVRAGPVA